MLLYSSSWSGHQSHHASNDNEHRKVAWVRIPYIAFIPRGGDEMKESLVLFVVCMIFALLVSPATASTYTHMSEANRTLASEKLDSLDIIGAIYATLDSIHWSNMANDQAMEVIQSVNVSTPAPTIKHTHRPTPTPTVVAMVAMEVETETTIPTTIPTTEVTTIMTTEPTPVPTKDPEKAKEGVRKAMEDSLNERAVPQRDGNTTPP